MSDNYVTKILSRFPPAGPARGQCDWELLKSRFSIPIPADYQELITNYGAGSFGGFIDLLVPQSPFDYESIDDTTLQSQLTLYILTFNRPRGIAADNGVYNPPQIRNIFVGEEKHFLALGQVCGNVFGIWIEDPHINTYSIYLDLSGVGQFLYDLSISEFIYKYISRADERWIRKLFPDLYDYTDADFEFTYHQHWTKDPNTGQSRLLTEAETLAKYQHIITATDLAHKTEKYYQETLLPAIQLANELQEQNPSLHQVPPDFTPPPKIELEPIPGIVMNQARSINPE